MVTKKIKWTIQTPAIKNFIVNGLESKVLLTNLFGKVTH